MTIQDEHLKMVGIGVEGDMPPNELQPVIRDGIHLRWTFQPQRGFPWHGYFLLRRQAVSRDKKTTCLGPEMIRLKTGVSADRQFFVSGWQVQSDSPISFVDEFSAVDHPELGLSNRRSLIVRLPEIASRVTASIGFLKTEKKQCCEGFTLLHLGSHPSPLHLEQVKISVRDKLGRPPEHVNVTAKGRNKVMICGFETELQFSTPASYVEVIISGHVKAAQISAYSENGKRLESIPILEHRGMSRTITFREKGISKVVLEELQGQAFLHQVCFWCEGPTIIRNDAGSGSVNVTALAGPTRIASQSVVGKMGEVIDVSFDANEISAIEFGSGPAVVVDVCFTAVCSDDFRSWSPIPGFQYPMCLPVANPDYPCVSSPASFSEAQNLAVSRVSYGDPNQWQGENFQQLHDALDRLVVNGPPPGGLNMMDRRNEWPMSTIAGDGSGVQPSLGDSSDLELVQTAAVNPAIAQMVGLYYLDDQVAAGQRFDYLLLADHVGRFGGKIAGVLEWLSVASCSDFEDVDGYIVYDRRLGDADPVRAPRELEAYALPGTEFVGVDGVVRPGQNNTGLRWSLSPSTPLSPTESLMYHVWRADVGETEPTSGVEESEHSVINRDRPLFVVDSIPAADPETFQRADDWPPFTLHSIDRGLADGWYSYCLSGIDIFGRHSEMSDPASWQQWSDPPPEPLPYYYQLPPANAEVHAFAIELLDKVAPPPPSAMEATALDPEDPYMLRDDSYRAWHALLEAGEQNTIIGLRVSWEWTAAHMAQAPDTAEFRIYYFAGPSNASPDHHESINWDQRIYVVPFNQHVTVVVDAAGRELRRYEVLIPGETDTNRTGLPLFPTLAEPISYASIGVTAVDDKPHSADHEKWGGLTFGDRFGNESRVSSPSKVFRVHRAVPEPPSPPVQGERVYASRADYHGISRYSFRWKWTEHLNIHVFRSIDDAIFKADWALRVNGERPDIQAADLSKFPDEVEDPRWGIAKREQVALELNQLSELDPTQEKVAFSTYRTLSDDALRVLAGLPGIEKVFQQRTITPIVWNDETHQDSRGPDDPMAYVPNAQLQRYVDELDGRSRNRYFYRCATIDGAQNRSQLSLSSPPVWLVDVVPPRTPSLTKILGSDRSIVLRWASNRESDLVEYRVYRTDDKVAAGNLRTMDHVHTVTETLSPTERGEQEWTDAGLPGRHSFAYRISAVDSNSNESVASTPVWAQAYDQSAPSAPNWVLGEWASTGDGIELEWEELDSSFKVLVQRRDDNRWASISGWINAEHHSFFDGSAITDLENRYRLKVLSNAGNTNIEYTIQVVPALQ